MIDLDSAKAADILQRLEGAAKWMRSLKRKRYGTHPSRNAAMRRAGRPSICDGCGSTPVGSRCLSLDHDHETGAFRGWLCTGCNLALGNAKDSPETLRRLADYLERPRGLA